MTWDRTGLVWIPPSPNIPTAEAALAYPATCYLEATNISEGRGTDSPFRKFGAPFIRGNELAGQIRKILPEGASVQEVSFVPVSSKHKGEVCHGVHLAVGRADSLRPVLLGLEILSVLISGYPSQLVIDRKGLARLLGDPLALELLRNGIPPRVVAERWERGLKTYRDLSRRYRLYPER
jgi:uncharacterized protein YbbC (DUF1343 family)